MLLVFQVFKAILLRTASDLSHFHVVGTNIVKKLMNNHMKLICVKDLAAELVTVSHTVLANVVE